VAADYQSASTRTDRFLEADTTEMSRHEEVRQSVGAVAVKTAPVCSLHSGHVKRNKGAAGVDGQSLSAFEVNLAEELSCLLLELKEKRYWARPIRRVAIAKDDGGGTFVGHSDGSGLTSLSTNWSKLMA